MVRICIQIHPSVESSSFSKKVELLQILTARKEAASAMVLKSKTRPAPRIRTSVNSKIIKSPDVMISDNSAHESNSNALNSQSTTYEPSLRTKEASLQIHAPTSRLRPAYASVTRAADVAALDQRIVKEWASYIHQHSVPKDAPSIPLSLSIGISVHPGFETHYKVAAFELLEMRSKMTK
jgi:hypothetical protein